MRSFIAIAAFCAVFTAYQALAEDTPPQDAVRMEMDQEAKAFVFIIDDEPVAMLDKLGLHVVEGIEYGRSLSDDGPEGVKRAISSERKEVADD